MSVSYLGLMVRWRHGFPTAHGWERGGVTLLNDPLSISTLLGLDCPVLCLAWLSSFSQTSYK